MPVFPACPYKIEEPPEMSESLPFYHSAAALEWPFEFGVIGRGEIVTSKPRQTDLRKTV
jgi:hypothetical protein